MEAVITSCNTCVEIDPLLYFRLRNLTRSIEPNLAHTKIMVMNPEIS